MKFYFKYRVESAKYQKSGNNKIKMESEEGQKDYEKRVSMVLDSKRYWSYWDVSERLKAMGLKRGFTTENIRNVFKRQKAESFIILQAAEEVIRIRKQIHTLRPIALMSKALIIEEYELSKKVSNGTAINIQ